MSTTGKRGRSLAAALSKVAPQEQSAPPPAPEPAPEPAVSKRLSAVTLYISPDDHERLRDLSYHSKISLQQLGVEAWNLLLERRGHPPLAPTTAARPSGRLSKK